MVRLPGWWIVCSESAAEVKEWWGTEAEGIGRRKSYRIPSASTEQSGPWNMQSMRIPVVAQGCCMGSNTQPTTSKLRARLLQDRRRTREETVLRRL
ncbi:hypothetical protein OH77DRAFT_1018941 [Trametes cingulata]|nr:hypothetical protein OH77DRAFT_1018941 [Trametes cingulata]